MASEHNTDPPPDPPQDMRGRGRRWMQRTRCWWQQRGERRWHAVLDEVFCDGGRGGATQKPDPPPDMRGRRRMQRMRWRWRQWRREEEDASGVSCGGQRWRKARVHAVICLLYGVGGGCNGRGDDGGSGGGKRRTHPVLPAAGSDGGRRGGIRCVACGGGGGGQRVS